MEQVADLGTEATVELKAAWMPELPCEDEDHDRVSYHDGVGEWYEIVNCENCGTNQSLLVCDTFVQHMVSIWDGLTAMCGVCHKSMPMEEYVNYVRRDNMWGRN